MSQSVQIKGMMLIGVIEALQAGLAAGHFERSALEHLLEPEDVGLLDGTVQPASWYDIEHFGRLLSALRDLVGDGSDDFVRGYGRRDAEKLVKAGKHQQLEYLDRLQMDRETDQEARFKALGRDLKLIATLGSAVVDLPVLTVGIDPDEPDRYFLEGTGVGIPDIFILSSEGFFNGLSASRGKGNLWKAKREGDMIRYRMTCPAG